MQSYLSLSKDIHYKQIATFSQVLFFQSFTTPLMDAPLLFLTAKAILVECEESLTACQVLIKVNLSSQKNLEVIK